MAMVREPSLESAIKVTRSNIESASGSGSGSEKAVTLKRILQEEDALEVTGYSFSTRKKWTILAIVAIVQTSMNYNAAVYSNTVDGLNSHYDVKNSRYGMMAFLLAYAIGCELWAPWSEEFGRWPIMQLSLGLVNVWQILCGASTNMSMIFAGRVLGGLSSAGGSVTLGMVADMWDSQDQQYAVAFVSLWSCLGSVVGGICGGAIETYLPWRWNFWIQLIFGVVVQLFHFFLVPETRSTVLLTKEAKRRRRDNQEDIWGPNDVKKLTFKEVIGTMLRPYHMLLCEPIVTFLSLLSGFSDALIFSFLESFGYVFVVWSFSKIGLGLSMISLLLGYFAGYTSFLPVIRHHNHLRRTGKGNKLTPESRLWWLLYVVPMLPLGIFVFAFVCTGPPIPWIAPLICTFFIGWANYAIYFATIDYMVAAYGEFAASATGGNGFMRDLLAGLCVIWTHPLYINLGPKNASFLLAGVALAVCIPVYVFYFKGSWFRKRSPFAQQLAAEKEKRAPLREEKSHSLANSLGGTSRNTSAIQTPAVQA